MAFLVDIGPGQRLIAGNCRILNADRRSKFYIEGDVPILRDNMIMIPENAKTAASQAYLAIQLMYLSSAKAPYHDELKHILHAFAEAAPSVAGLIYEILLLVERDEFYKALKETKKLIDIEAKLLAIATANAAESEPTPGA